MVAPTQLNPTEQDALVKQIGLALLRAAPADWTSVEVAFRAIGRYSEVRGQVSFGEERTAEFPITPEVANLFVRLRAGMYREGRGTWFNARYQLDRPAAYNLEYDRDEPHWQHQPPPPAFVDELRMFPREEENVPEWLARRLAALQPPFRTARMFDGMGPAGPVINRPPLDADEREQVQRYLDAAPLALPARGYDTDHLDEERRQTVPVAFHTDGVWIWPAAVNFYLRTHGVPPDPELVAHARRAEFRMPEVAEPTRQSAAIFIAGPPRPPVRPAPPAEPAPEAEPVAEPAIAEPQSTQAYVPGSDDEHDEHDEHDEAPVRSEAADPRGFAAHDVDKAPEFTQPSADDTDPPHRYADEPREHAEAAEPREFADPEPQPEQPFADTDDHEPTDADEPLRHADEERSFVEVEPTPAPADVVDRMRERLSDAGVAEWRYTVGAPSQTGWAMEQTGSGWRVGWFDGHYIAPAVFAEIDDAAAFLAGKLLLESTPDAVPTDPGPSTVRASLAELEDDDDDTYDQRPRRPLPPPSRPVQSGPSGDDLFRPVRPVEENSRFAAHQFDDEEDDYRPGRRRQPDVPLPETSLFSPSQPVPAQENGRHEAPADAGQPTEAHRYEGDGQDSADRFSPATAQSTDERRFSPSDTHDAAEPGLFTHTEPDAPEPGRFDSPAEPFAADRDAPPAGPFGPEPGAQFSAFEPGRFAPEDEPADQFASDDRRHASDKPEHDSGGDQFQPQETPAPQGGQRFAPEGEQHVAAQGEQFTPAATADFAPKDEQFTPEAAGDFAPRSDQFTPATAGAFAPQGEQFSPATAGTFAPQGERFTPETSGDFAPRGEQTPSSAPGDQSFSSGQEFAPRSEQFTPATAGTFTPHGEQSTHPGGQEFAPRGEQFTPATAGTFTPHGEQPNPADDQRFAPQAEQPAAPSGDFAPQGFAAGPRHAPGQADGQPVPEPGMFSPHGDQDRAFAQAGPSQQAAGQHGFGQAERPASGGGQFNGAGQPGFSPSGQDQHTDQLPHQEAEARRAEPQGIRRPQDWPIQPLSGEPPLTLFRGKQLTHLPEGAEFDRYGDATGNLTYAVGTPFDRRSLVPEWINRPYRAYRVLRPTEVLTGSAIPWFDQPGGGTAYVLPRSVAELVDSGAIEEIPDRKPPARA
ncbi:glycohydrolase toxin TNT-related protein [Actinokineospora guangxiensis]|uniref:Glycohydrolase toxin TNT-related protein n=1 Tax=Actinokineospora guangxiensis TaxID=1490288 RepID=A0ABW0EJT8_9PSEU